MAEISSREKSYSGGGVPNYESRKSEVDFSDVFGGPPRRSWTKESNYSEGSSIECHGRSGDGTWFKSGEKPVFGNEVVERRTRYTSDDFFDDVFRGDESSSSCSQSPRVMPRGHPLSSAPNSRAISPSRSLPLPTLDIFRFKGSLQTQQEGMSSSGVDIHFSFHKWVNNGVPLIVSLRKRRTKLKEAISDKMVGIDILVSLKSDKDSLSSNVHHKAHPTNGLKSAKVDGSNPRLPLRSFFQDSIKDSKETTTNTGGKESMVQDKRKQESPRQTKKDRGSDVKGKIEVKSLAENFNIETRGVKSMNESNTMNVSYERTSSFVSLKNEMQDAYESFEEAWPNISELVDETSFSSGGEHYTITDINKDSNIDVQTSNNESSHDFIRNSSININIGPAIVRNTEVPKNEAEDANQVYQIKVSQWAKGKEGNIRSLLSTLQLVLWENSGWKPIPLVEIIEANAVKRAYQKAMLCLHPDKLQQKGVASHHKFVAEKVFNILQEAWDNFNSLINL